MPTEEENVQYLYLVLTHGGAPSIDWESISKALNLSSGATSKRWSRLRQAMESGKNPGSTAYQFLWLCLKHSARDKAMDWNEIAKKCGTTSGAASKRYSRMKQAFDKGDSAPTTPPKGKTGARGPMSPAADPNATPTLKRKRASAANGSAKKKSAKAEDKNKPDDFEEDDEGHIDQMPKRAKANTTKPRAITRCKDNGKQPLVKAEPNLNTSGFLNLDSHRDSTYFSTPNGTQNGSVNPSEGTILIKSEPDALQSTNYFPIGACANGNSSVHGYDDDQSGNGGGEQYYDATEFASGEEEGDVTEKVHDWLEEV